MRSFGWLVAAVLVASSGSAFAQGREPAPESPADPVQSQAIDDAYRGRCEPKAPRELCSCVISVANVQINDLAERQVFFDFMMGDLDKAKTARGMFSPDKNMKFNIKLQKADVMLGDQCDRLKPKPNEQRAGQPGQKLP